MAIKVEHENGKATMIELRGDLVTICADVTMVLHLVHEELKKLEDKEIACAFKEMVTDAVKAGIPFENEEETKKRKKELIKNLVKMLEEDDSEDILKNIFER